MPTGLTNAPPAFSALASLSRLAPVAPYTGFLATGTGIAGACNTSNFQMMSRSPHFARDAIKSLAVILPGWYGINPATATNTEHTIGANTGYTASIEYPSGTFKQITFAGSASGTVTDGGQLTSDQTTIAIPRGALFWIRVFYQNTAGIIFSSSTGGPNVENGGILRFGASGVTDQTMGGTITSSTSTSIFTPLAIIGTTTQRSFALIGTSRNWGYLDSKQGSNADVGNLARSIGKFAGYANLGVGGDRFDYFIASHTNRVAIAQYASDAIIEHGINDLTAGRALASILADQQTLRGYLPSSMKVNCVTVEPVSTSSDSWATTTNQTINSNNPTRVLFNNAQRALPAGFATCLDIADVVESGRDSGKWTLQYGTPTTDGTHETLALYQAVAASGMISPSALQ